MMAAMAKRSGLNADRSEMTSFNRNDEGYQQHVPLDALIAQAKSNPTAAEAFAAAKPAGARRTTAKELKYEQFEKHLVN